MPGVPTERQTLNAQQRAFVELVLSGATPSLASERAGYARDGQQPASVAARLMQHAGIARAIRIGFERLLSTKGVPIAVRALIHIAQNERYPAAARVAASNSILDRAGIVARKAETGPDDRPLNELSLDDLRRIAAMGDQAERELGDRAKPVNAPKDDPLAGELSDMFD